MACEELRSTFQAHVLKVMDAAEEAIAVITHDSVQVIEDNTVEPNGLMAFSRQPFYLLSLITKNCARLLVRSTLVQNGLKTWRLLTVT